MRKVLKYLGIVLLIGVILLVVFAVMGQFAVTADKEALTKLQDGSLRYYEDKGTFVNFCSSDIYKEIDANFTYDITCWNDHIDAGLQVTVHLASEYFLCKPATIPPVGGKTLKTLACIQTPGPIFEAVR